MEGIAMETGQSISDSNLQEIMQSSALSVGVDVNSGINHTNGQASAYSWQGSLSGGPTPLQHGASSGLELMSSELNKEVTNGRQDQGVDEVEYMSSSPSSSSSDSP